MSEIKKFYGGFVVEHVSGQIFRFNIDEETRFIQDTNLYLKKCCADIAAFLNLEVGYLLITDELVRQKDYILSRQEDLFALLSKNQLELDCLLKVARLRPMLLVKLNMNCFSVWTMAWLFVQPSYPLSGITDLFKVIEMSLMRHDVMENFYQLAYLGAERSEILGWIYANWKDCHMNRREVQIFLKKKQNKETFFSQLKRIMFNH